MALIARLCSGLGLLAVVLLVLVLVVGSSAGAATGGQAAAGKGPEATAAASSCVAPHWVGTWAADPSDGDGLDYINQTLRVIVTPHYAGTQLRVHLSNRFGSTPVTFGTANIGRRAGGGAGVVGGTNRPLTFGGASQITVAPGTDVVSDPVSLTFRAFQELSVSLYVAGDTGSSTEHVAGDETSYFTVPNSPNATGIDSATPFTQSTTRTSFVDGLDVLAPGTVSALVGLGDSITDGIESFVVPATQSAAIDANSRYTDYLSHRFSSSKISVVNAGLSGNQLLDATVPQAGPSGLSRLQSDVLDVPGVSDVIVEEGINDLGQGRSASDLEAGLTTIVSRLHAAGLNVLVATIMPVGGVEIPSYATPAVDADRTAVNNWLRAGGSGADGTVDFDGALRDPGDPSRLLPAYDSGDHVHPSNAGYRAMSNTVDPALIRGANCGGHASTRKVPTKLRVHVASRSAGGIRLKGRLYLAAPSADCIGGHVTITETSGRRTIVRRVARLYQHCAFAATLAIPAGQTVSVKTGYGGNTLLGASHATTIPVHR